MTIHNRRLMTSKLLTQSASVIAIGVLMGVGLSSVASPLFAQSHPTSDALSLTPVLFRSPPLSPRGAPGDRTGGGTRDGGNCPIEETSMTLTALVPLVRENDVSHVWSVTTQPNPTLWVHVPYVSANVGTGRLAIWDETNPNPRAYQLIYEGEFTAANTPGVVGLRLPDDVALDYEKSYHWYISMPLVCESDNVIPGNVVPGNATPDNATPDNATPDNATIVISGWIERVSGQGSLTFSDESRNTVATYAQQGIWQDAITLLAELRQSDPTNTVYLSDWEKLLSDVALSSVAEHPLVSCCELRLPED